MLQQRQQATCLKIATNYSMRQPIFAILFSLLLVKGAAQEEFITPSKMITRIPFRQLTGGVVLIKAAFSNFPDSLNFILDTGSGGISLDSATVAGFNLVPEPSGRTIRGVAGMKLVSFLNDRQLHLPNLSIDSLNFHVNDYSILTAVYGEKIDGIIGYSVFRRYIVKLNYDSLQVEFWTQGSMKYPKGGFLFRPTIATLPVQSLRIRDEREVTTRFLYDLGAGLNMMLSSDFVKDSGILQKKRVMYIKEAEGLGGKIDMKMTVIKEVRLGPYRFRNVPVFVFDDIYNVTSYPYLGGLVGNDLLRRFNAILNYEKRDFYLIPNSHYKDQFDYSYSGIELYNINGEIIIGDVAKGSAAEKAGLQEGDLLIAVNKNFSQNLQQYKTAMQTPGDMVRLLVQRAGQLLEIQFRVKNIMH